jgi:general secretion pathway protein I
MSPDRGAEGGGRPSSHLRARSRRPVCGFTLIEVLVALVIVAVGMSALMGALSSSARSITYMQDKTFAEWVALNKIANVRLSLQAPGQLPPTGNTTGDVDYAGRSWHWRQEVVASQVPGIERIDVKVRPKELKAGDDEGWYVTVSGIAGNALGAPGMGAPQMNWDPDLVPTSGGGAGVGTNSGTPLNQNGQSGAGLGSNPTTGTGTTPTPRPIGTSR